MGDCGCWKGMTTTNRYESLLSLCVVCVCVVSWNWFWLFVFKVQSGLVWFGLWLHKNCFISFNAMLNVGGAITSTNGMRSHSFNAAQLIVHTSVSAPTVKFHFCKGNWFWTHIWFSKCMLLFLGINRTREIAKKSILQSQISKANELNSIPSNGKSRIENAFIERNTLWSFDFPFNKKKWPNQVYWMY